MSVRTWAVKIDRRTIDRLGGRCAKEGRSALAEWSYREDKGYYSRTIYPVLRFPRGSIGQMELIWAGIRPSPVVRFHRGRGQGCVAVLGCSYNESA